MGERELLESARNKLRKAEALTASAIKDVNAVVKINSDDGRADLANAAFMAQAEIEIAAGTSKLAHAKGTAILLDKWPGWASEVVVMGPPR